MSKLTMQLIVLSTILIGWGILMLSIHYRHKKRMKEIDKEWEERRWRLTLDRIERQWNEVSHNDWQIGRRSAMVPNDFYWPYSNDEVRKTDKLSPPKKMGKHTMR